MTTPTEDVLCLLAAMVLADDKIYACEIEAFAKSAKRMGERYPELRMPDEGALFHWFEVNRGALRERLTPQHFEPWITQLCARLKDKQTFMPVAKELFEIAQADGQVHVSETALIALLKRGWSTAA